MSRVFVTSDLHLGHKNIARYRGFNTIEEHDNLIINNWNKSVSKKDLVYLLGDITMELMDLSIVNKLNGNKNLILGNHERANISEYLKYFNKVYGIKKYRGYWLSHAPIHPSELRGKKNIHGHIHNNYVKRLLFFNDKRYINACLDVNDYNPIEFNELIKL